jgi:hypothetical protein
MRVAVGKPGRVHRRHFVASCRISEKRPAQFFRRAGLAFSTTDMKFYVYISRDR